MDSNTDTLLIHMTKHDLSSMFDERVRAIYQLINQQNEINTQLATVEEAAKEIKVCPQTIRNLYSKKQINRFKVGRRVLVDLAELKNKIINSPKDVVRD